MQFGQPRSETQKNKVQVYPEEEYTYDNDDGIEDSEEEDELMMTMKKEMIEEYEALSQRWKKLPHFSGIIMSCCYL